MEPEPVVILVHGAWHGPWAWSEVVERLMAAGVRTVVLDLPSSGPHADSLGDLHGDADMVRTAVAAAEGPALVVAHSYGGLPVSEGGGRAEHIIFVTAFVIEPGESLLGLRGGNPPDWWLIADDGLSLLPDNPEHVFYNDCQPEIAARAISALEPQSWSSVTQELRSAAWQTVPSTYVICERDNAIPPEVQEIMSEHADTVVRLDASHSPFLSRPDDLTAIVMKALSTLR